MTSRVGSVNVLSGRPTPLPKYGRGRADPLMLQMADPRQLAWALRSRFAAVKVHRTLRTLTELLAADPAHKTAPPQRTPTLVVPSAVMVQLAPSAEVTQRAAQRVAAWASQLENPAYGPQAWSCWEWSPRAPLLTFSISGARGL